MPSIAKSRIMFVKSEITLNEIISSVEISFPDNNLYKSKLFLMKLLAISKLSCKNIDMKEKNTMWCFLKIQLI